MSNVVDFDAPGSLPVDGDPEVALVKQVHNDFRAADDHSKDWRAEAREDYGFYSGDQWDDNDRVELEDQDRPAVTFNRVGTIVDAITGIETNNRQEARYIPRTMGDVQPNEMFSSVASWAEDLSDTEDEESDAFHDLVVCGMGWAETRMDYSMDPEGRLIPAERIDPLEMWWDPSAKKKNLSDRRWCAHVKSMPKREAISMWPQLEEQDPQAQSAPWDGFFDGDDEGVREHTYPQDAYDLLTKARDTGKRDIVRICQYQYVEYQSVVSLMQPQSGGKIDDIEVETYERLREDFEREGWQATRPRRKASYRQAFLAGHILLEDGEAPDPGGFSIHSITGKRERNKNYWRGAVRNMVSPQRWSNKFMSTILEYLNSNAKGGVIAEQDAFEDSRKAEDNWARPDGIIWASSGAVRDGKIMPKPISQIPPQMEAMFQFSVQSIRDVGGANLELLGMADRQQPGVLEYQRKQSAVAILAHLFDGLRKYRKARARCVLEFIRRYVPEGTIVEVVGEDGANSKYLPFVKDPNTEVYDVIIDDAPTSPNQKERVFGVLSGMMPGLLQAGIPIPPEILDYSPLPSGLVEKWKQLISKPPSPEQQQQTRMAMEGMAAETEKDEADAEKKRAEAVKALAQATGVDKGLDLQGGNEGGLGPAEILAMAKLEDSRAERERKQDAADRERAIDWQRDEAQRDLDYEKLQVEREKIEASRSDGEAVAPTGGIVMTSDGNAISETLETIAGSVNEALGRVTDVLEDLSEGQENLADGLAENREAIEQVARRIRASKKFRREGRKISGVDIVAEDGEVLAQQDVERGPNGEMLGVR